MAGVAAASRHPSSNLRHAHSLDNFPWLQKTRKEQWLNKKNCPVHGSQGKCTCASSIDEEGTGDEMMGSSDSLQRSGEFGYEHGGSNNDLTSSSIKPFNNNPPLPNTQRDVVGNNLRFNSASNADNWNDGENSNLRALLMYRDALKRNLTTPAMAGGGLPKMRHGRIGSQWRHIKQTNTYSGSNLMFIDGTVRVDDSFKYPIPRFGYPPLKKQQHVYSGSNNDLSYSSSNPATKSLDTLTWSATDALNRRPSLAQYANRYQRHAQDRFAYWPTDLTYKKPRDTHYPMDENSGYEPRRPVQERSKPGSD
jgi:hypothetical protein